MRIPFTTRRVRKLPAALLAIAGALQLPAVVTFVGGNAHALSLTGALTLAAALTKSLLAVVDDAPSEDAPDGVGDAPAGPPAWADPDGL